ncbi:N-formylglutamate amidohydrolase [Pseudonocardia spinosispora]|uniref:N-formylglutamate amidohydrolase n=1 Tax=Pseudonocardia spinosispora TaxID=103441 RepID=UPI0003F8985A|nr:N-formylglutamate amidohydrolase [Pseudonocardia spinosispora]
MVDAPQRHVPSCVPGDPASSVLLHVPHAGRTVPEWVRDHILLDDGALAAEQAALTDHDTDDLAIAAADVPDRRPFALVNDISRLVVDVERFPDEREEMSAVGMAAVYTRTSRGQPLRSADTEHRDALLAAYYLPWAAAVRDAVDGRLAATGAAVIVDVHSYPRVALPYELHGEGPRPHICLGTDPVHTPDWLLDAASSAFAGFEVGHNSPFAGTYVPLAHLGSDPRVASIMIEIRRDCYLAEPDGPPTPDRERVVAALGAFLSTARPHRYAR